jgi:ribosomal protein L11 methyltransferase
MSSPSSEVDYPPFVLGARFRVVPPGHPAAAPGGGARLELVMPRGAFGSGEHETTASCVELIEELDARGALAGARVLDLGSGTGILGLAALLLGADHVVMVDVDPRAVAAAGRAVDANGLAARVTHVAGRVEDLDASRFDVAFANLQGDILLGVAEALAARVRPGGWLLLSGIVWELNWSVRQRYADLGCEAVRTRFLEEYSSVLLRRAT